MLKIGVLGAGHLGKIHIQQWKEIEDVQLVGFYDPDDVQAASAIEQYNVVRFSDMEQLIHSVDAVDIVAPTTFHYELAKACILNGKHLFIEKPIANTLEEARELVKLVEEANIKCQIGHVERFNPAFLGLGDIKLQPLFIESHRLAQFNPRGTDVAVVLDLMIHDIDIILHLVKSSVRRVSASGVSVISETADISNARIEFDNGCVANITASRMSLKKMRKMRIFQRDAYIGIDFLDKKAEIIKLQDKEGEKGMMDFPIEVPNGEQKIISVQIPEIKNTNAIKMELSEFKDSILNNKPTKVTVQDGLHAIAVAHEIIRKMGQHNEQYYF